MPKSFWSTMARDRTGEIIDRLMAAGLPLPKCASKPTGDGSGIISGLEACRAPAGSVSCADGQVAPEDVVRTYRLTEHREERVLAKVPGASARIAGGGKLFPSFITA
jgi:hypothetical protein